MNNNQITFDENAKKELLNLLDKSVDAEGFIVEKSKPSQRVLSLDGYPLTLEDFAGVRKGSEIFIKSDFISLIDVFDILGEQVEII